MTFFTIWEVTRRNEGASEAIKALKALKEKAWELNAKRERGIQIEREGSLGFTFDNQAVGLGITEVENNPKAG